MNILKALFFSLAFLCLPFAIKRDFKLPPIHAEIPFHPEWEGPPLSPEIFQILNQPFTYLAHGNQATVFLSLDGQYVLKLFRYRRSPFSLIHHLKSMKATYSGKKPRLDLYAKIEKTFLAAQIACTEAKEFTQAVYCHLNLTQNLLPLAELNASRKIWLPLDRYRFVLQKKVAPFKETLLRARSDPEEMQRLTASWIDLLFRRSSQGIRNSDPNLGPNFGFLNGKAVEIDFGNYHKAPQTPREFSNYLERFEEWVQKNAPEHFDRICSLTEAARIAYAEKSP